MEGKIICNEDSLWIYDYYFFFAVPPSIIDARTSADIVVKEGSPVNLSCDARGSPRPKIMWKREDGDLIRYNGGIHIISFR